MEETKTVDVPIWWSRPCPVLSHAVHVVSYNAFDCHAFSGVCEVRATSTAIECDIFVKGATEPRCYLRCEEAHPKSRLARVSRMIWEALSRFGMVGPDSLRVVEQTKEWAVSFRQTNHPLATVRRQISGLKAIANENDADDEALDWMQKRVTLIHATLEKLKKKPRVRAANRRLAVCCNERSTLPLFLLDGGHPIVGPSDDLCLWIRRGDKMYASICVDRDRRQRADWVDFVLDVMHHSDYSGEPLLSAPVGTWDVLVIDLDAPADRRTQSWAEVLMSHGVDADRIVYAAERDDSAAHNPDIVACAHDFQTLASFLEPMGVSFNDRFASIVLGCFGWSRAQMSRPFMRLAQKSEKTTEYTISEGTPVQIVS